MRGRRFLNLDLFKASRTCCAVLLLFVLTSQGQARNNFINISELSVCFDAVLVSEVFVFQLEGPLDAAVGWVYNGSYEISTKVLSFPREQSIYVVAEVYAGFESPPVPVRIVNSEGSMTWEAELNLPADFNLRRSTNLLRTVLGVEIPQSQWEQAFPDEGLYRIVVGIPYTKDAQETSGYVPAICHVPAVTWIIAY